MAYKRYAISSASDVDGQDTIEDTLLDESSGDDSTIGITPSPSQTLLKGNFTPSGDPGVGTWEVDDWDTSVDITDYDSDDVYLNCSLVRYNTAGWGEDEGATSSEQQLTGTGVYTFSSGLTSIDFSDSSDSTDRLCFVIRVRNNHSKASKGCTIAYSSDTWCNGPQPFPAGGEALPYIMGGGYGSRYLGG